MSGENQNLIAESQQKPRKDAINALDSLLTAAGFDAGDLQIALEAIKQAKEHSLQPKQDDGEYRYFLDRTLVYEDKDAFIYKRADTKSGRWYFRIYDTKSNKAIKRALKTTDKTQALITARTLYIDIKGKIDRGERLKSITTLELIEEWDKKLKTQITNIPHEGITPDSYKQKRYFLRNWIAYINHLSLGNKSIDKIDVHETRDFGTWLINKPKETSLNTGNARAKEGINNNISEVIRMYHQLGVRERYISVNQVPEIDRVKVQKDEGYKRDIMNEEQYEKFWRWIQNNYITKKHNPLTEDIELEKRKIWKEFIFIISNVGFRSKELLGIKMSEIMENPNWDSERRETDLLMKVRKENSKTGRARVCVAPVKKRIERILSSYKKIGIVHKPDDFLFINPISKERKHYGRMIMYNRLKDTLERSGLKDDLAKEGKSITIYSFRHQYACWRLRYGDVPIHLLAKQMGTSIQKIEQTYGHIEVEQQAEVITKAQDRIKKTGFVLNQPEVIEGETIDEYIHSQTQGRLAETIIKKEKTNV